MHATVTETISLLLVSNTASAAQASAQGTPSALRISICGPFFCPVSSCFFVRSPFTASGEDGPVDFVQDPSASLSVPACPHLQPRDLSYSHDARLIARERWLCLGRLQTLTRLLHHGWHHAAVWLWPAHLTSTRSAQCPSHGCSSVPTGSADKGGNMTFHTRFTPHPHKV